MHIKEMCFRIPPIRWPDTIRPCVHSFQDEDKLNAHYATSHSDDIVYRYEPALDSVFVFKFDLKEATITGSVHQALYVLNVANQYLIAIFATPYEPSTRLFYGSYRSFIVMQLNESKHATDRLQASLSCTAVNTTEPKFQATLLVPRVRQHEKLSSTITVPRRMGFVTLEVRLKEASVLPSLP